MYANTAKEIPKGCKTNNKIMQKKIHKSSRPSTEIIPEDSASPEEVCRHKKNILVFCGVLLKRFYSVLHHVRSSLLLLAIDTEKNRH